MNEKLSGFLLLNKAEGISSNSALYPIKKLLPKGIKIGHSGTLDPNATGLLVIAIGRATRLLSYLPSENKEYEAELLFGKKSDSQDIWGEILAEEDKGPLSESEIISALNSFVGEITQVPPMYSALKKDGVPLYKLARQGISIERKPRLQLIHSLELVRYDYPYMSIRVKCSKGTYIRTLIEDLAAKLGRLAVMSALVRTVSDGFSLKKASDIRNLDGLDAVKSRLIGADTVFSYLPNLNLDEMLLSKLRNGIRPDLSGHFKNLDHSKHGLVRVSNSGVMQALLKLNDTTGSYDVALWI